MIPRLISVDIAQQLSTGGRIVLLFGARQVGKTTLVRAVLKGSGYKVLYLNGDDLRSTTVLSSRDLDQLRGLVSGYDVLFVDEAQRIPEIGLNLKLLADHVPQLRIIATGSSSLDLASKTREALTGRAWIHTLFPIAHAEMATENTPFELNQQLESRLRFGSYPALFAIENTTAQREYVQMLADSYLYKDVLEIARIKHPAKLRDLLQLLAYQVGNEVSMTELAAQLQISRDAVNAYLDLLEQSFVIFRLRGFNRNLRKEVTKLPKFYFWDVGVRNALVNNFDPLQRRADVGALWENYVIAERRKLLSYRKTAVNFHFWRTHTGAELDLIEHRGGEPHGYEFKWGKGTMRPATTFLDSYPHATTALINQTNYSAFLTSAPDE
ncbi:MAG TPA: ATP-binding protein [Thermoflexales bacterium]|jgi:predicted AAA+ superfamily ATPase|nr:ATP-binding protein [Thermoflexales bacterium]HQZ54436.1 ATP-binding protein [Thermoflexales bacterium]